MPIILCDNCGKEFYKKPNRIAKTKNSFCCSKCHDEYRHHKKIEELSDKVGMSIDEWLIIEYIQNQKSIREIANQLFGNPNMKASANKLLHDFNIPLRHGSEAVKTQWTDAEERRAKHSANAVKYLHTNSVRNKVRDKLNNPITREKISESRIGSNNPSYTHGKTHTRLYNIWHGMKSRCYNENNKDYRSYGGRGIKVCHEWLHNFQMFYEWSMTNGYSSVLSIDRIDNDGNYEPLNCRWATAKEQRANQRNKK